MPSGMEHINARTVAREREQDQGPGRDLASPSSQRVNLPQKSPRLHVAPCPSCPGLRRRNKLISHQLGGHALSGSHAPSTYPVNTEDSGKGVWGEWTASGETGALYIHTWTQTRSGTYPILMESQNSQTAHNDRSYLF